MEKADKIRELQKDRRNLEAEIQSRLAALRGLDAYLSFLTGEDVEPTYDISLSSFQLPIGTSDLGPPQRDGGRRVIADGGQRKMILAQEVRRAVQEIEGEFTQQDVTRIIKERHPNEDVSSSSVYNAMWKMERRGELERVREGVGSEPHVFCNAAPHRGSFQEITDEDGAVSG